MHSAKSNTLPNSNVIIVISSDVYKRQSFSGTTGISGCDSGFGHFLAKRLDSKGFHVFATCLFPDGEGAMELKKSCSQRLRVLHLDVTKDDSVKEATQFVEQNLGTCDLIY
ncbi:UNVERIFIED_CONTAM: Hsd17b2 [Trichonephila clavipes]